MRLPRRLLLLTIATLGTLLTPRRATADARPPLVINLECDPLPFATGGYGCQVGVRPPALHGVRIAAAQFSLDVPDVVAELGGNDGFHVAVRPGSGALYALYYLEAPGRDGFAFGGSLRYLCYRYTHDDAPDQRADQTVLSPEVIAAYQWHPFDNGFYVQPWIALSVAGSHSGSATVGGHTYDELPVSPFFTVNLGWEHSL